MEGLQLRRALRGEHDPALDLLGRELHQILVDDVPDMFQVDRKGDDLHGPVSVLLIQALSGELGDIQFHGLIEPVHRVVHPADFRHHLSIIGHQCRHRPAKPIMGTSHSLDHAAQTGRLPCSTGALSSMMSPMCSVSRAAQASATEGVPSALSSR